MPAKPTTPPTSTLKWSKPETDWLVAHLGEPRSTMVPAFRTAFPKATMTDVAIAGKAYHLGHGSGVKGLDAQIARLETRLDDLRTQRVVAESKASAKLVADTQAEVLKGFPRPATKEQAAILKAAKPPVAKKPAGKNAPTPKPKAGKVTVTKAAAK